MINIEALFTVTYGLYVVCSGDKTDGNGYISNTVFQVTSSPPKFATCCNKDNYTAEYIKKHQTFSVSILHTDTDPALYGRFGYQSGHNLKKLEGIDHFYGETGVPIVTDQTMAWLEFKVVETIDVGTHLLFIGELIASDTLNDALDPITYAHYRKVKKGVAPKNAPTYIDKSKLAQQDKPVINRCIVCGHEHNDEMEDTPFNDLPDDWMCPVCGADKEDFETIN